jgi:hypothetical protein
VKHLLLDPQVYRATCLNLARTSEQRSMARFVDIIVAHAVRGTSPVRKRELTY